MGTTRVRGTFAALASVALVAGTGVAGAFAAPVPAPTPESAPTATATPASGSVAEKAAENIDTIKWTRCSGGLQCGSLTVPLDYKDASKGTINLSIARRPADNQKKKQGVLFVNPGGPGGSSVMAVSNFADIVGRDVRGQFDIVGVDPRGVGGSDLAVCNAKVTINDLMNVFPQVAFPISKAEIAAHLAFDEFFRNACSQSNPRILNYMTTADVARDMDRVREVLGQKQLNYYGVSYGSYLGVTYSAMFPQNVRTMVVDGVLDPQAWRGGPSDKQRAGLPVTTRLKSGEGGHEALFAAFAECERAGTDCVEGDDVRNDWNELSERLRKAPIQLRPIPEEPDFVIPFTYQDLIVVANSALYDAAVIPDLIQFIHLLNTDIDAIFGAGSTGGTASAAKAKMGKVKVSSDTMKYYNKVQRQLAQMEKDRIGYNPPEEPAPPVEDQPMDLQFDATFAGVLCSETTSPTDPNSWVRAASAADKKAPGFAPLWTWNSSACSGWKWKGVNAYEGSFASNPAGGMLVMSTIYDPATPYHGARKVRSLVQNSRLITVPGWGHGTLDESACATKARTDYLLTGKLPAKDMSCRPDHPLFTTLD